MIALNDSDLRKRISAYKNFMGQYYDKDIAQKLFSLGFFTAPASTIHNSYEGGLCDHSIEMAKVLLQLTKDNHLKWAAERSPLFIGIYHGLWKMDAYLPKDGGGYRWNPDQERGQGERSVKICERDLGILLTEEEKLCIRWYAGAFTKMDEWPGLVNAMHKNPNVAWTAHADILATHTNN